MGARDRRMTGHVAVGGGHLNQWKRIVERRIGLARIVDDLDRAVPHGVNGMTVADGHERRKPELLAMIPALGDHLRANAGRIADRDCEWCQGRRGHSRL